MTRQRTRFKKKGLAPDESRVEVNCLVERKIDGKEWAFISPPTDQKFGLGKRVKVSDGALGFSFLSPRLIRYFLSILLLRFQSPQVHKAKINTFMMGNKESSKKKKESKDVSPRCGGSAVQRVNITYLVKMRRRSHSQCVCW